MRHGRPGSSPFTPRFDDGVDVLDRFVEPLAKRLLGPIAGYAVCESLSVCLRTFGGPPEQRSGRERRETDSRFEVVDHGEVDVGPVERDG